MRWKLPLPRLTAPLVLKTPWAAPNPTASLRSHVHEDGRAESYHVVAVVVWQRWVKLWQCSGSSVQRWSYRCIDVRGGNVQVHHHHRVSDANGGLAAMNVRQNQAAVRFACELLVERRETVLLAASFRRVSS